MHTAPSGREDGGLPAGVVALLTFLLGAVVLAGFLGWAAGSGSATPAVAAPAAADTAAKLAAAAPVAATPAPKPAAKAAAKATKPAAKPAQHGDDGHDHARDHGDAAEMDMTPAAAPRVPYGAKPLAHRLDGDVKVFRMTAEVAKVDLGDGEQREIWGYNGQAPGPLLRARVGDRIRIEFQNRLPEPTTIHWHGLDIPVDQDGVPSLSQEPVPPGGRFTYEFDLEHAGTFMYHPHFNTLEQQSKGLTGVFIVDPKAGPEPGVQDVVQVLGELGGKYVINGRIFPATDANTVRHGRPVRIRLVNVGEADHPMHLHGLSFSVVAENGSVVPAGRRQEKFTQVVAPGETYEIQYTPRRRGVWLFHCHILSHVTGPDGEDTGMVTTLKTVA